MDHESPKIEHCYHCGEMFIDFGINPQTLKERKIAFDSRVEKWGHISGILGMMAMLIFTILVALNIIPLIASYKSLSVVFLLMSLLVGIAIAIGFGPLFFLLYLEYRDKKNYPELFANPNVRI